MLCKGYIRHCRKEGCEFKYKGHDKGLMVCPTCGTPREPCKKESVPGYDYCENHGGPNPIHNFYGLGNMIKTGVNSKFPLVKLASKYIEMQNDGRLLSNKASMEMVRRRITELAERIDMNQAPDRLENIRKLWEDYKQSKKYGIGMENETQAQAQLDEEFEKAYHDYAAWKQMFEAIDIDRKLVESEVKIIKDIHAVLTVEDAYELTAQLMAALISTIHGMTEVPEDVKMHFLKRIQYEFTRIVGDRFGQTDRRGSPEDSDTEGGEVD